MQGSAIETLTGAFVKGLRLGILLVATNVVWVMIALALGLPGPHGTPIWLSSSRTILEAVSEHAIAGFLIGATTLSLQRALIGAAFQPLIDIDHFTAFANLPVDPRIGHSIVLMIVLILAGWLVGAWSWGSADLALFVSSQFLVHFAVAPPGFPLLSPLVSSTFYFSSLYAAIPGIAIAAASFVLNRHRFRILRPSVQQ